MSARELPPLVRTPEGHITRHAQVLSRHTDGSVTVKVWGFLVFRTHPLSHEDILQIEAASAAAA